jgi:hypothetical protein
MTAHGHYGYQEVFSVTEKRAKQGDPFTVTGTVTTPYATGSTNVPGFSIPTADVPWASAHGDLTTPPVSTSGDDPVIQALFTAENNLFKRNALDPHGPRASAVGWPASYPANRGPQRT